MLPATIFRQVQRNRSGICKGLTEFVIGTSSSPTASGINCLNRYVPATGFLGISFLDISQYQSWNVATLRLYADAKKHSIHMRTLQGKELLHDVIEKKRESFIERKNFIVEDIRVARTKVQERVREKMEEVIERENILTIPNMLTMGRAFLSPYIGYVIVQGDFSLAMSLLAVAGITDLLDGQIARRWPKQSSKAGSFLDPMADKLLIGSLVISMGYCDLIPIWLAGTILFRDVFLLAAGFVIRYISLPPPKTLSRYFDATHVTAQLEPTFISKVNTVVQLGTIGISLGAPIWNYIDHVAVHSLWYLTGATTVAAALSYILNKNTFRIIKRPTKNT
ncbi:probable cardiolipin synthase (CMP-forming) [Teleopsis dalmanni]|uniref:probable cardiolipin synthase (CMP-forming) n=1 Tax=Teleopsis dalmanni TaxID=139649 RepID=UPI0018CD1E61|nr:probable cardiolipin synthase (CMP-forming) [Teleopsis dalmanni]XP_037950801.1 probable cardiolipin synthase (CMP-forming) [Teleopsis dalmanni]